MTDSEYKFESDILLPRNPTKALHAATKDYVDSQLDVVLDQTTVPEYDSDDYGKVLTATSEGLDWQTPSVTYTPSAHSHNFYFTLDNVSPAEVVSDVAITFPTYTLAETTEETSGIQFIKSVSVDDSKISISEGSVITAISYEAPTASLNGDTSGNGISYVASVTNTLQIGEADSGVLVVTDVSFADMTATSETELLTDVEVTLGSNRTFIKEIAEDFAIETGTLVGLVTDVDYTEPTGTVEISPSSVVTEVDYTEPTGSVEISPGSVVTAVNYTEPTATVAITPGSVVVDVDYTEPTGTVDITPSQVVTGVTYTEPTGTVAITPAQVVTDVAYTSPTITGNIEVVTGVSCVDGEITVTKTTLNIGLSGGGVTATKTAASGTVTLTGGKVETTKSAISGVVTLSGGKITKTMQGVSGTVAITGGKVEATTEEVSGTVEITGGKVEATTSDVSGTVAISGGNVTPTKSDINLSGVVALTGGITPTTGTVSLNVEKTKEAPEISLSGNPTLTTKTIGLSGDVTANTKQLALEFDEGSLNITKDARPVKVEDGFVNATNGRMTITGNEGVANVTKSALTISGDISTQED